MSGEKTYKVLGSGPESGFCIDDAFVEAVEDMIGMDSGAWDMVEPKELISVSIAVFMQRYGVREQ